MSEREVEDGDDRAVAGARWPDIAVRVEPRWIVPRWLASSVHPELGAIEGRGLSHEAAVRSLVRGLRRRRFEPAAADRGSPDSPADAPVRALPP